MRTAQGTPWWQLSVIGCGLLLIAGCSGSGAQDAQARPDGNPKSSSSTQPGQDQNLCALLTDDQLSAYMRDDIPEPERSNERDRPTCTWEGTATNKVKLSLWTPPVRTIITDDAERTINVGEYTGYIQAESDNSCKLDIEGPERFLDIQIDWSKTSDKTDRFCDSLTGMAQGVIDGLDW